MLKFMRKNAQAPWVRITFLAIVIVFIFWGVGMVGRGSKLDVVARINSQEIEPPEFQRAYSNLERMYRQIYKDNMPPGLLDSLDLRSRAMDQIVRATLLTQEAHRIGLQVGDAELADSIRSIPAFQDNGVFNKARYFAVLRSQQPPMQPGDFEEAQRQELLVRKMSDIVGAGVQITDAALKEQYHLDNDQVNLQFARVKASDFEGQVQPTDADLKTYYDAHKEDFRIPERVRIEYLKYQPSAFEAQIQVTDAEVQDYYDIHREQYNKAEEVHARHILFHLDENASEQEKAAARKKAEDVLAKAKAGEDFAELAKQYSEDEGTKDKGGDLGFFKRGQMVAPFEQAAFGLEPGAISDIVESPFGLHIIKVEEKHPAQTQTVDQVRPEIVAAIKKERGHDLALERAQADREKAVKGETLEALGKAEGITPETPSPFARKELIPGIGRQPKIADEAFAAAQGEVPEVVDTPAAFYVFRVVEKIPSRVPELTEVRNDVEKAFRKHKTEELAKQKADELLKQLQQQKDFAGFAAANGLTVEESGPFSRAGSYIPKLGAQPDLKKVAFQLSKDKSVAPATYEASGDAILAALKEILPADDAKFEQEKDTLRQQAIDRRRAEVDEQFLDYLKKGADIEINQNYLASNAAPGRR